MSKTVTFIVILVLVVIGIFFLVKLIPKPSETVVKTTEEPSTASEEKPALQFQGVLPREDISNKIAALNTDKGVIKFELFDKEAPKTASNFVYLAKNKFYDGLTFHRVEPGFVIQGGDPKGDGTGGPGYQFPDEPVSRAYDEGIVAMANSGPNTNGSQFFIMLADRKDLPKLYTIFGKVTSGMEVVKKIEVGDVMRSVTIESK